MTINYYILRNSLALSFFHKKYSSKLQMLPFAEHACKRCANVRVTVVVIQNCNKTANLAGRSCRSCKLQDLGCLS